ncbi:MAG TPA: protein kinase [Kofleriaceae bacterium]|nr:protein kinase [Kofleriaceae bacterium]
MIRQIAVGGMAELYLTRTVGIEGFEKLVCVKRILPQFSDNPSFVNMFLNEARLAATLHHPNIAQIYDIGQDAGEYFFAMEYVHGEDLGRLVATGRESGVPISPDCALTLVAGLCAGLHHAHEKASAEGKPLGVVHRDVSPTNVLVSYDGAVKLVDFGIARAGREPTSSQTGLKGKIAYMSPEQCRGKVVLDRRSDVFSVGTILFELTTGRRPFVAETEYGVLQMIVDTDAPRPSALVQGYPPALEAILMRALARDRDRRFSTALELQNQLEDFAHDNRLRVSPLVLARLMSTLFPARLEEWDHARSQGAFFVEQHVVRTLIESGKTTDSSPAYLPQPLPPVDDASGATPGPELGARPRGPEANEPTELVSRPLPPPSAPPGIGPAQGQAQPRIPTTPAGQAQPRIPAAPPSGSQPRIPTTPPGAAHAAPPGASQSRTAGSLPGVAPSHSPTNPPGPSQPRISGPLPGIAHTQAPRGSGPLAQHPAPGSQGPGMSTPLIGAAPTSTAGAPPYGMGPPPPGMPTPLPGVGPMSPGAPPYGMGPPPSAMPTPLPGVGPMSPGAPPHGMGPPPSGMPTPLPGVGPMSPGAPPYGMGPPPSGMPTPLPGVGPMSTPGAPPYGMSPPPPGMSTPLPGVGPMSTGAPYQTAPGQPQIPTTPHGQPSPYATQPGAPYQTAPGQPQIPTTPPGQQARSSTTPQGMAVAPPPMAAHGPPGVVTPPGMGVAAPGSMAPAMGATPGPTMGAAPASPSATSPGNTHPSAGRAGRQAPVPNMPGAVPIVMPLPPPPVPSGGTLVSSATQAGTQPPPVTAGPGRFQGAGFAGAAGLTAPNYEGPFGAETPPGGHPFAPPGAPGAFARGSSEASGHPEPHVAPAREMPQRARSTGHDADDATDQVTRVAAPKTLMVRRRGSRLPLAVLAIVGAAGAVVGVWFAISGTSSTEPAAGSPPPAAAAPASDPSASEAAKPGAASADPGGAKAAGEATGAAAGDRSSESGSGEPANAGTAGAAKAGATNAGAANADATAGAAKGGEPGEAGAAQAVDGAADAKDPKKRPVRPAKAKARPDAKRTETKRPDSKRGQKPEAKEPSWNADSPFLPEVTPKR